MIQKLKKKKNTHDISSKNDIPPIWYNFHLILPSLCFRYVHLWYPEIYGIEEQISPACVSTRSYRKRFRELLLPLRYISSARPQASSNFSTDIPRSLKSTPSCSSFYRSFHTLIGVLSRFAPRSDRRQLKRSYRPLQRKAALYSRLSVKGSISRLFRNKSRANREIHRWANTEQYYLATERSLTENLLGTHYAEFFYRRFSTYDESWKFFSFFFRIFLF